MKNLITIGSFDGVHRGHQALLERAVHEAKKRKMKSLALTFAVPPRMILHPQGSPRILSDAKEKEVLLRNANIDEVMCLNFDRKIAALKPFAFFYEVLFKKLSARGLVVGHDFRFGTGRAAGALELVRWGEQFEIPVWVIANVKYQKQPVSSSLIRHLFETHHFQKALGFLGHPYLIRGAVVADRGVGRKLGFATANLKISPGKILPQGVFVVRGWTARSPRKKFTGVCNIGVRPTFLKTSPLTVEVHIFNEHRNLRNQTLFIELLHRLRPEKKFKNAAELTRTIRTDIRRAKSFLTRNKSAN